MRPDLRVGDGDDMRDPGALRPNTWISISPYPIGKVRPSAPLVSAGTSPLPARHLSCEVYSRRRAIYSSELCTPNVSQLPHSGKLQFLVLIATWQRATLTAHTGCNIMGASVVVLPQGPCCAMSSLRFSILVAGLAGLAVGYSDTAWKRQTNSTGSPCASVSYLASSQTAASPSATATVPAKLAYECINSVPLNVSAALDLIETVKPYWEWQSTIAYLKNPPAEYVEKIQDPVDVFGELDIIEAKVKNGSFASEYEVRKGCKLPC